MHKHLSWILGLVLSIYVNWLVFCHLFLIWKHVNTFWSCKKGEKIINLGILESEGTQASFHCLHFMTAFSIFVLLTFFKRPWPSFSLSHLVTVLLPTYYLNYILLILQSAARLFGSSISSKDLISVSGVGCVTKFHRFGYVFNIVKCSLKLSIYIILCNLWLPIIATFSSLNGRHNPVDENKYHVVNGLVDWLWLKGWGVLTVNCSFGFLKKLTSFLVLIFGCIQSFSQV